MSDSPAMVFERVFDTKRRGADMAHDAGDHEDIIDDPEYWRSRCSDSYDQLGLHHSTLRAHHLRALTLLADDILTEVLSEPAERIARHLRVVR